MIILGKRPFHIAAVRIRQLAVSFIRIKKQHAQNTAHTKRDDITTDRVAKNRYRSAEKSKLSNLFARSFHYTVSSPLASVVKKACNRSPAVFPSKALVEKLAHLWHWSSKRGGLTLQLPSPHESRGKSLFHEHSKLLLKQTPDFEKLPEAKYVENYCKKYRQI